MRFKTDWASLIVGSKFTIFTLFYFVFEGNLPSTSPRGAYIWRGDLTEGFFVLPVWGAYIWRGLYKEGLIFGILRYPRAFKRKRKQLLRRLLLSLKDEIISQLVHHYYVSFFKQDNKQRVERM